MDASHAWMSRTVDAAELGRRIRAARVAAGLTQAEVAAGDMTAAYLSRVERGQRRLAAGLLEKVACRLNTTASQLVTGHTAAEMRERALEVERAAVLVALGRPSEAEQSASHLLERLRDHEDDALRATALRIRAEAYLALGQTTAAAGLAESLTHENDLNSLRAMILLCRCQCLRGEAHEAIAGSHVAHELVRTLGLQGLGEDLRLAAAVAEAKYLQGDVRDARNECRKALDASASLMHDGDASRYLDAATIESASNGATPAAIQLTAAALVILEAQAGRRAVTAMLEKAERSTGPDR